MKKIVRMVLPLFGLILGLTAISTTSFAAEDSGYGIVITKYKIDDKNKLNNKVPTDGTKAEHVTDANGKSLETLSGISYEITRVSPVDGTTNFQPVQGSDAFSTTVTTNSEGIAQATNLAAGTYRVTEKNSNLLKEVMEPVIFELPLPQRNGEALKEVYLYPKSGVVGPETPGTPGIPGNPTGETPPNSKIPQTSGNIGNYKPFVMIFTFLILIGVTGFRVMWIKKNPY